MKFLLFLFAFAACHFHVTEAPAVKESSTYLAYADGSQGTAWAVGRHHLVTAGHVCSDAVGTALKYVAVESNTGERFRTEVVEVQYNDLVVSDVCLLESPRELPAPLSVADRMPAPGDAVEYTGYPHGHLVHATGVYSGDVDGDGVWSDFAMTAPCNHGASGSAVLSKGRVFGVLVRLIVTASIHDPVEGCVVSPLDDLRAMLVRHKLL